MQERCNFLEIHLDIQGDVIAVCTLSAAVHIYVRNEGNWTQTQKTIKELVEAFAVGTQIYGDKGWLPQKWILLANRDSPDVAFLDAKIVSKLDDLLRAYHNARDERICTLLAPLTYGLEAVMKEQMAQLITEFGKDISDLATE